MDDLLGTDSQLAEDLLRASSDVDMDFIVVAEPSFDDSRSRCFIFVLYVREVEVDCLKGRSKTGAGADCIQPRRTRGKRSRVRAGLTNRENAQRFNSCRLAGVVLADQNRLWAELYPVLRKATKTLERQ